MAQLDTSVKAKGAGARSATESVRGRWRVSDLWFVARTWALTHRLEAGFIVVGLVVRIVFWQVTERKFEDGLITVVHARGVLDGPGLTHHPFEPVAHGFTSAVSVLVPLVGEFFSFLPLLDGFLALRLASLAAFVATILAAWVILERLDVGTWPRASRTAS